MNNSEDQISYGEVVAEYQDSDGTIHIQTKGRYNGATKTIKEQLRQDVAFDTNTLLSEVIKSLEKYRTTGTQELIIRVSRGGSGSNGIIQTTWTVYKKRFDK